MRIETDRFVLRPFRMSDLDVYAPVCADPEVMKYIETGTYGRRAVELRIKYYIRLHQQKGYSLLALDYKEDNNKMIGFCGLIDQEIEGKQYVELGYRLAKEYWNRGIASEAAREVRDYAFNVLGLPELLSIIHVDNVASRRVSEKLGFKPGKKIIRMNTPVRLHHLKKPLFLA